MSKYGVFVPSRFSNSDKIFKNDLALKKSIIFNSQTNIYKSCRDSSRFDKFVRKRARYKRKVLSPVRGEFGGEERKEIVSRLSTRLINRRYETEPRKHVRGRGCGITSPPDYFFQRRPSDLRPALTLRLATLVPPFHASRGRWNDESVCTLCTAFNRTHNVAVRVDRWTFRLEATPRHDGTVVRCLFRTRTIDRASWPTSSDLE